MGTPARNIQVRPADHDRLKKITDAVTGMSIKGAVTAVLNVWDAASEEVRVQGMRAQPPLDDEPSALGDGDATDPRRESIRVSCRAARLVDKVDRALRNDNLIDAKELRELVDELKGIQHGAERVAHASKRAAKAGRRTARPAIA